jgi:nucleoid-associated protein YgaU
MGKLEKLIVLAVLFAAAVVLAVSLHRGKDEGKASDPLSGARDLLEETEFRTPDETPEPAADESGRSAGLQAGPERTTTAPESAPSLLLHAGPETAARQPISGADSTLQLEPASDPTRPILLDRQGLRPSFMDEYMMYTVVEGDTWASLAQRFYQDGRFTRNLHLANEDMDELLPGKGILVPVFDLLAFEADEPSAPAAPPESAPASASFLAAPAESRSVAPSPKPTASEGALVYEVRAGDTLSDISLASLGTSTRWKELLELNADLMKKPEDLRVGMKLKLPSGAKVPSVPKAAPKASTKSAKVDQTVEPVAASAPKKRKVL